MKKTNSIRLLFNVSKPGKGRLSFAAILIFFSSICSIGPFYIAYLIIEKIINPPLILNELYTLGVLAALSIIGQLIFSGTAMIQSHIAAYNILFQLRVKLAEKMLKLPLGYYGKTSSGIIKKIMMGDIEAIEEFIAHNLVDLISVIFVPLVIFIWLSTINMPLAFLSIFPVIAGIVLQRIRMKLEAEDVHDFFKLKGQMNTTIIDFIRGMPIIKAFNQSVFSFKKYKEEAEAYSNHWISMNKKAAGYFAVYAIMMDSGIIFLLPAGGYMYLRGTISLSSFLLFMFLGLGLTRFMKQLTQFGSNITQISKGVEGLNEFLAAGEIENKGKTEKISNYNIEFENVSFGYDKNPIIRNINFEIKQGTTTALVGPSGAGKTTIGQLIPRFWDIDYGAIKIGDINIRDIRNDTLMKNVSFVFQDIFMFNDSVFENIRMGDTSISTESVINIAKKAQCHNFITNLEDGYETMIGVGGTYLSGGEQQRIAIARAIAKDSPIIILDEATSYADPENETKIQTALAVLLKNKTVIIIAHRLSSIQNVNQILVFDQGRIIERGNHRQLLSLNGKYKKMWDLHIDASEWGIGKTINYNELIKDEI